MKKTLFIGALIVAFFSPYHAWTYDSVLAKKIVSFVDKKAEPAILRLDSTGQPWVLNRLNGGIQRISPEGKPAQSLIPVKKKDASFREVSDFVFYKDDSLYVSDPISNKIFHIDRNGKTLDSFDTPSPAALAISLDDAIAAGLQNEGLIRIFSLDGVALHDLFLPGDAGFKSITSMSFSRDGVLWALDGKAGKLHRFSAQRKWLGSTDGLDNATALTVDIFGFAYVTLEKGQWKEIDFNGKITGTFGTKGKEPGKMSEPSGIAMGDDNLLWVCEMKNNRLQAFSVANQNKKNILLSDPALRIQVRRGTTWPIIAKAALPQNDGGAIILSTIKKTHLDWISKTGEIKSTVNKKEYAKVVDITQDANGAVWILDSAQSQITKISDKGEGLKTVGQKGKREGGIIDPELLRVRNDGSFVVVDKDRSRIQVLSSDGLFLFTVGKNGSRPGEFKTVTGLATSEDVIAIVDNSRKAFILFDKNGKFVSETINQDGKPQIWNNISDVASDASGRFYVLDKGTS